MITNRAITDKIKSWLNKGHTNFHFNQIGQNPGNLVKTEYLPEVVLYLESTLKYFFLALDSDINYKGSTHTTLSKNCKTSLNSNESHSCTLKRLLSWWSNSWKIRALTVLVLRFTQILLLNR